MVAHAHQQQLLPVFKHVGHFVESESVRKCGVGLEFAQVIQNNGIVTGLIENQHVEFETRDRIMWFIQVGRWHIIHDVLQRPSAILQRQNGVLVLNVRIIADAKVHGNGGCPARKPRAVLKHGFNAVLLFFQLDFGIDLIPRIGKILVALKVADQF